MTLQGRPKSNRKQLPQLNFDFPVESVGKFEYSPTPSVSVSLFFCKKCTLWIFHIAVIYRQGSVRLFFGGVVTIFKVKSFHICNYRCEHKLITDCVKYSRKRLWENICWTHRPWNSAGCDVSEIPDLAIHTVACW